MFGAICKQEYGRYTVRTPFGLVVAMVLISMLSSSALACGVRGVEIYAGRSFTEAHDQIHDGKDLYIAPGETVYFCGVVGRNRTENDLIYRWDFKDGTVVQYDRDHDDYHEHIAHTYSSSSAPGVYGPSLKVWPEGTSGRGGEADMDECIIEVVEVKLYRDSAYTKVLDDWPASGGIHSPKYIFGKDDAIYVQVKGLGSDPSVAECITQAVQVISESDTSGNIYLNLCETGTNTQIFRNSLAVGELLYLADFSASMGSGDRIKVIDEEVLTFKLRCPLVGAISSYSDSADVMVDRGEYSTGAGRSYDSRLVPPDSPDRTPLWNDAADEFKNDITDWWEGNLDWWDVGEVRGSYGGNNNNFKNMIKDAGENDVDDLESDFFYAQCHGNEDGELWGTRPNAANPNTEVWELILDPASDFGGGDWNNDLDWAIIKACSVLKHDETGRDKWEAMLKQSPRRVHGILGFEDPSASDYQGYVDDFMDEIGARHTLISCWINGNTSWWRGNQPYGIVYHTENADDRLRKASEGVSLTRDVSTSNFSYCWRDSSGQSGTDAFGGAVGESRVKMEIQWHGLKKTQEVRVGRAPEGLERIRVSLREFDVTQLAEDFTLVRRWKSGEFKISRDLNLDIKSISSGEAMNIARKFVKQLPLPDDACMVEPEAVYLSNPGQPVLTLLYTIIFTHRYKGCVLAGDHITLQVQADGVKMISGLWHDVTAIDGRYEAAAFTNKDLEECFEALARFYPMKRAPDVRYVRPVYYVLDGANEPRVVWEAYFEGGRRVFWDPAAKQSPNYFEHIREQHAKLTD